MSHQPDSFNGHGGDRGDIMFLVVEEEDSTCSLLNLSLMFFSKADGMLCSHTHKVAELFPMCPHRWDLLLRG